MVLDAPLLFETKILEHLCHPIIVVSLSEEQEQHKRMLKRDAHVSEEEAWRRIKAQMPLKIKERKADIVVINDGT